jgi:hypothetical protein
MPRLVHRQGRFLQVVNQETRASMFDDLGQGAGAARDDRSAICHRLDGHEPEWLWPCAEHHRRQGTGPARVLTVP